MTATPTSHTWITPDVTVQVSGTAQSGSTLTSVTVTKATGTPPAANAASGTFSGSSATVTAGSSTWTNLVNCLGQDYTVSVHHTSGAVSDLNTLII